MILGCYERVKCAYIHGSDVGDESLTAGLCCCNWHIVKSAVLLRIQTELFSLILPTHAPYVYKNTLQTH